MEKTVNPNSLFKAGVFRTSWLPEGMGHMNMVSTNDGWSAILDPETVVSEALFRIADAIDVIIPYEDLSKALVNYIVHKVPALDDKFVSYPSQEILSLIADSVEMDVTNQGFDPSTMSEIIEMNANEKKLQSLLLATIDGHCSSTRLVHQFGWGGRRTKFNFEFLPTVPFVLHEKNQPVKLLGYKPHPKLHKSEEQGRFISLEHSDSGDRCLLEFIVSEEAVEGNSFNIPVSAKEAVAGNYKEARSGVPISFSLDRKNARKFSGMGKVVRNLYPKYVSGQTAWVVLDKNKGAAYMELHDTNNYDARQKMRDVLQTGIEAE